MSLLDEFIDDLYAAIREAEYSPSEFAFDDQLIIWWREAMSSRTASQW